MIWIAIIVASLVATYFTLGALSVWVTVLFTALKAMLIIPVLLLLYSLWQLFFRKKS